MIQFCGRKTDLGKLTHSFNQVQKGNPKAVLVSGPAGSGKTALVTRFAASCEAAGALFAYGKADAVTRSAPFSTLTAAMNMMVKKAIAQTPANMKGMRDAVGRALNPNLRADADPGTDLVPLLNLVPALSYLFGQAPAAGQTPVIEGAQWVHLRLLTLLEAFAAMRRPLILFLDDLQWMGAASHAYLQYLIGNGLVPGLLLIMAFRSENSETGDALKRTTTVYQQHDATLSLKLNGLTKRDTRVLLKARLKTDQDLTPLADTCHGKTAGNPFYLTQLLDELLEKEMIFRKNGAWRYDISRISGLALTENVIDLLIERMRLLDSDCLDLLKQAACIQSDISVPLLEATSRFPGEKIQTLLWKPIQLNLVHLTENGLRFAHDRISESLEAQLGKDEARAIHRRLVAFFLADERRKDLTANIFTLLHHYGFYADTIADADVKVEMAGLYYIAGEQARGRSAYALALAYFTRGKAHFPGDIWTQDYALALRFSRQMAECAYLAGDFAAAERAFEEARDRAGSISDRMDIEMVKIPCYQTQGKEEQALEAGLGILRDLGFRVPDNPSNWAILHAILKAWARFILSRKERLVRRRMLPDTDVYKAAKCVGALGATLYHVSPQKLLPLLTAFSFNLALKYGNMAETPVTYIVFGMMLSQMTGTVKWGRTLGKMSRQISHQFDDPRLKTKEKTMINVFLDHWDKPLTQAVRDFASAEAFCLRHGDHEFYAYNALARLHCQIISSMPFAFVLQSIRETKKVFARINNQYALTTAGLLQQAVANLDRGVREPWILTGEHFDETDLDDGIEGIRAELSIYKLFIAVYCGRMDIARDIRKNLVIGDEMAIDAYQYNYFLFLSTLVDLHLKADRKTIKRGLKQLKKFAAYNQAVYENKYLLALGVNLRIKGDPGAAQICQEAATAAEKRGFRFEQAMALEGLGRLSRAKGDEVAAEKYFDQAIRLYKAWGLKWKQRLFDETIKPDQLTEKADDVRQVSTVHDAAGAPDPGGKTGTQGDVNGIEDHLRTMKALTGATVIHVTTFEARYWKSRICIDDKGIHRPAIFGPLPEKMLAFACATGEVIQADADSLAERYFDIEYFLKRSPTSLLVIPGKERNAIYIENGDIKVDTASLSLLAGQILAYVRPNATVSTTVEDKHAAEAQQLRAQCRALQEYMTTRKVYRDPSLSLARLAKAIGMPQRVITDAINTCLGQNFKTFVNSYRIEAVKRALSDPAYQGHTIIDIAYAQGFNSKSTFNSAFKESVGTTPSKYRARLSEENGNRGKAF